MSIVLANGKKAELLEANVNYLNTLTLRLFVNNLTPTGTSVAGDFTQPTDSGYGATIPGTFGPAALNGSNKGETTADPVTWVFTFSAGAFTVYGYYFTDPADGGALVYSERAATPFTVTGSAQTYSVVPRVQLDTM